MILLVSQSSRARDPAPHAAAYSADTSHGIKVLKQMDPIAAHDLSLHQATGRQCAH